MASAAILIEMSNLGSIVDYELIQLQLGLSCYRMAYMTLASLRSQDVISITTSCVVVSVSQNAN